MIAIIQFRTDASLQHEQACYQKYLPGVKLEFLSIFDEAISFDSPHQLLKKYDKVILAGSGQFLLSNPSKKTLRLIERIEPVMDYVIRHDFPTLGVCFGNQLLGMQLGSRVINDKKQAEAGIQEVDITREGAKDPIFAGISSPIYVSMGHEDSLENLPKTATHLATSSVCPTQGFRFGNNVYGLQFHVELDNEDLVERLSMYSQYDEHLLGFEAPHGIQGPKVLASFATL